MAHQIIIRETEKQKEGFSATVQFGSEDTPQEITITKPFSDQQEKQLEWYFEQWLLFPFTDKVRAKNAAQSVREYGISLFGQVFTANHKVAIEYDRIRKQDHRIEIFGSPEFHSLHWEAMQDPELDRPLSVEKPIVRKNTRPVLYRADVKPAPHLRVLLVTARPGGTDDVGYRTISRPLVEALETAKIPTRVDMVRPGTFEALVNHLEDIRSDHGDGYYHIIHLDMHGSLLSYEEYLKVAEINKPPQHTFQRNYAQTGITKYQGLKAFLLFNGVENGGNLVSADDLAALLKSNQIPIMVLNACQSGKQVGATETSLASRMLDAGVQLVVGMGYSVTVSAAELLMTTLYKQLLEERSPSEAIRRARLELFHNKKRRAAYGQMIDLEDWMLPVIYQNRAPEFDKKAFQGQVASADTEYAAPRTEYGFVGRDMDILAIEQHLLTKRNLLLTRGMGGAGKTTLLHHLGWWWQKTRFVEQVFYFGYDRKAYHLPEIIQTIGGQLNLKLSGIAENDQSAILQKLKSTRHLLILDNLESITGEPLAIQNTLPADAQAELRNFLQKLLDGRTIILLGSRSGEEWLRPDPLRDNDVYDIPGLDYEARTDLAEAIIKAIGAPNYPEQEDHQSDFRRLLKLLGGYPLAMEVVLADLAQNTPARIIERLQAANVNLNNQEETADKTQRILKCIDYSHSNLSEDAQALLLCLAPFTGVLHTRPLENYSEKLKSQPALANLPFDRWPDILQEAINWGLLQPHEQLGKMGYLHLQPIFPYFLKARLNDASVSVRREAIETAFYQHYKEASKDLAQLIASKESRKKQIGHDLLNVEYENLMSALQFALHSAIDYWPIYDTIDQFLLSEKNFRQRMLLANQVVSFQNRYSLQQNNYVIYFAVVSLRKGNCHQMMKQFSDAEKAYRDTLQLLDSLEDQSDINIGKNKGVTLHQLGCLSEEQRKFEEAKGYYKKALKIKIEFNDRHAQANTIAQLGSIAYSQRKFDEAESHYKEALKIFTKFDDRHSRAKIFHQLGRVAQEKREFNEAKSYFKEALEIYIESNDRYEQAATLHHLGMIAQKKHKFDEADGYYKKALKIKIEFNDRYNQATVLYQLGRVAQEKRKFDEAKSYFEEALEIYAEFNDLYEQAGTLHQLGRMAQEQREFNEAKSYFKEAEVLMEKLGDKLNKFGNVKSSQTQSGLISRWRKQLRRLYNRYVE